MFKVQSCFVNTSCFEQIVQLDFRNCDVVKPEEEEEKKKSTTVNITKIGSKRLGRTLLLMIAERM